MVKEEWVDVMYRQQMTSRVHADAWGMDGVRALIVGRLVNVRSLYKEAFSDLTRLSAKAEEV